MTRLFFYYNLEMANMQIVSDFKHFHFLFKALDQLASRAYQGAWLGQTVCWTVRMAEPAARTWKNAIVSEDSMGISVKRCKWIQKFMFERHHFTQFTIWTGIKSISFSGFEFPEHSFSLEWHFLVHWFNSNRNSKSI